MKPPSSFPSSRWVKLDLVRTNMEGAVLLDPTGKIDFLFRRTACVVGSTTCIGPVHLGSVHFLLIAFRRTHSAVFRFPGSPVAAPSGSSCQMKTERVALSLVKIRLICQKQCWTCQWIVCSWSRKGNTPLKLKAPVQELTELLTDIKAFVAPVSIPYHCQCKSCQLLCRIRFILSTLPCD